MVNGIDTEGLEFGKRLGPVRNTSKGNERAIMEYIGIVIYIYIYIIGIIFPRESYP